MQFNDNTQCTICLAWSYNNFFHFFNYRRSNSSARRETKHGICYWVYFSDCLQVVMFIKNQAFFTFLMLIPEQISFCHTSLCSFPTAPVLFRDHVTNNDLIIYFETLLVWVKDNGLFSLCNYNVFRKMLPVIFRQQIPWRMCRNVFSRQRVLGTREGSYFKQLSRAAEVETSYHLIEIFAHTIFRK